MRTEEESSDNCYSSARQCLISDYVENEVCHQHLKHCLYEEDEEDVKDNLNDECSATIQVILHIIDRLIFIFDFQECLTGSSLTSASCYDYLQHYVNEKVCFQENHQESHQHEEDHQYSYNQNNHNFNNNDYWNNFMNNLHNGISFFA